MQKIIYDKYQYSQKREEIMRMTKVSYPFFVF